MIIYMLSLNDAVIACSIVCKIIDQSIKVCQKSHHPGDPNLNLQQNKVCQKSHLPVGPSLNL